MANENKRDYYEVLGLKKDATDADIKRAYRKLARAVSSGREPRIRARKKNSRRSTRPTRCSPIRISARATISTASRVSTPNFNPNAGGSRGSAGAGFGDFGDLGDIFGSFFGGGGRSTRRSASAPMQGDDIGARVELTFEEAAFGAEKEVTVSRVEDCDQCHGSGCSSPARSAETCPRL